MVFVPVSQYEKLETGDAVNLGVTMFVMLALLGLGLQFRGVGVAIASGVGLFVLGIGSNLRIVVEGRYFEEILLLLAVLCILGVNEALGSIRLMTKYLEKIFKGKLRLTFPFAAASWTFMVACLGGQALVGVGFFPLFIEVAKDINLRPNKVVLPAVVATVLGDLVSPISYTMTMYSKLAYMMGGGQGEEGTETYPAWNDTRTPRYTLMDASLVLIPAAYAGVLAATALSLVMGKKLDQSNKFKSRLVTGDCHCNYPERYLTDPSLAAMARNLQTRAAKRDGVVLVGDRGVFPEAGAEGEAGAGAGAEQANSGLKQKPLPYFSQVSLLSEGDYVYTSPILSKASDEIVDINKRAENPEDASRFKPAFPEDGPKSQQGAAQQEEMAETFGGRSVAHVAHTYKRWHQWLAIGLTLTAGVWGIVYPILHDYHLYIIPESRVTSPKIAWAGGLFSAALLAMGITRTPGSRFQFVRYFPRGIVAMMAGVASHAMVSSWAAHWLPILAARYRDNLQLAGGFVLLVESFVAGLASDSWHAGSVINLAATTLGLFTEVDSEGVPKDLPTVRIWVVAIILTSAAIIIPWHSIALCAIEFDDTRTIRAGRGLFDNYLTPVAFVAVIVAAAVAYALALAIFDGRRILKVSDFILHNWNTDDTALGLDWAGLNL